MQQEIQCLWQPSLFQLWTNHLLSLLAELPQPREFINDQIKNGAEYVFNPNRCLPVNFYRYLCMCVCVRCWQPGFATWQDEDWIGRVPWHACMHVWNPYACSCGWCKRLCLWMFYPPLHIFASILGLQGKPALSCIWHSNQNNNTLS